MNARDRQSLLDILQSTDLMQQYLDGKNCADLDTNNLRQDGVVRRLEIVGEAALCLA